MLVNTIVSVPRVEICGSQGQFRTDFFHMYDIHIPNGTRKRVNFNDPADFISQADELADLLSYSKTDLLVEGLRTQTDELVERQTIKQWVAEAFFEWISIEERSPISSARQRPHG